MSLEFNNTIPNKQKYKKKLPTIDENCEYCLNYYFNKDYKEQLLLNNKENDLLFITGNRL